MSYTEQYLILPSEEQDPGVDTTFLRQQAEYQSRNEYSSDLVTSNHYPPSWLSPISPGIPNDEMQWDQILEDFHRETESQDPNNCARSALSQKCSCFTVALTAIQQLSQCSKSPHVKEVGRLLEDSRNAVKVCEQFSSCRQSCHQKHILLYIAMLEQVDGHYSSLGKLMVANDTNCQRFTLEVIIGSFTIKTSLDSDIGKALLKGEMKRASVCTRQLAEKFQLYVKGGCTAEVKCQQEILSALADNIGHHSEARMDGLTDGALSDIL